MREAAKSVDAFVEPFWSNGAGIATLVGLLLSVGACRGILVPAASEDSGRDASSETDASVDASVSVDPSYYRVIRYGALGDGIHDDRPAIQAAMDAAKATGGTVYFDPGIYLLASSTAPGSQLYESDFGNSYSINLVGYNATLTTSEVGGALLHAQGLWQNSTVRGLTFVNTHGLTPAATVAVELEGTGANQIRNWTLTGNTFRNFSTFINTSGADTVVINNNDFIMERGRDSGAGSNEAMPTVGIWTFDNTPQGTSVNIQIIGNRYNGCGTLSDLSQTQSKSCGDGFAFGRSIGSLIHGNTIKGFSAESIFVLPEPNGDAGCTVSNNIIDGTMIPGDQFGGGLWGVRADAAGTLVEGNIITNLGTGIFSCSPTFCGGNGLTATGIQISNNVISTADSGSQVIYAGIEVIGISSSNITGNRVSLGSGSIPSGSEAHGIGLSGANASVSSDSMMVTGNTVVDNLPSQGGGVAGIFMEYSSNWTINTNVVSGFSYGFDFLNQPGTTQQLDDLLAHNTLTNNDVNYRLLNGSF